MSEELDLSAPDSFTVGTIGEVGSRLFLIQCTQGLTTVVIKVEKSQVAVLASYLARIVRELGRPDTVQEQGDFDVTAEPDWVAGTIGVAYDEPRDRLMVVIEELVEEDEEGITARIALTREQAAGFAIHATQLVEAGRPPCPLCGFPLDPSGHNCPRTNGHRPPAT